MLVSNDVENGISYDVDFALHFEIPSYASASIVAAVGKLQIFLVSIIIKCKSTVYNSLAPKYEQSLDL